VSLAGLAGEMSAADVVLCATGASAPVISRRMLAAAVRCRHGGLVVLDLAVPRDVDPAARDLPRVTLRDLDEVHDIAAANRDWRRRALPHAWSIVHAESQHFAQWRSSLEGEDLLAGVRRRAEEIRQGELRRVLEGSPGLDDAERARLEAISRSLVNRLLHEPSRRLRAAGATPHGRAQLRALADLVRDDAPAQNDPVRMSAMNGPRLASVPAYSGVPPVLTR
jgi:glutamyl-tRNA reductase